MRIYSQKIFSFFKPGIFWAVVALLLGIQVPAFAQPANDNCVNARVVNISAGGFGLGVFTSTIDTLTIATVQPGETFAPAVLIAGLNKKSIWYKFTLPTSRAVRVSLSQPGVAIPANGVGFAVYKTNNCLPTGTDISTKLTAHTGFDSTYNPCIEPGDYLVQVSANDTANGPVYITVKTAMTTAAYDQPSQAFDFGTLSPGYPPSNNFNIDCQSIEDAAEICNTLGNYQDYNKSTWHVFRTPAYLDYLSIGLNVTNATTIGFKVYQGDVRSAPYTTLPVIDNCDSLVVPPASSHVNKIFTCNEINPNTTYSVQLFYNKNFTGTVDLAMILGGFAPTIAPEPILSAITPTANNLGVLPSNPAGVLIQREDYLACNARHSIHPCNPSLPATGVINNGKRYNLSSFFMFTLPGTSNLDINVNNGNPYLNCGPELLVRLYSQNVPNNCSTLDTTNIIRSFITSSFFTCLPPGNYTLQVMGQDSSVYTGLFCLKSNLGNKFYMNMNVRSVVASNKFSLSSPGAFDTLNRVSNVMQPLVPGVNYISKTDTFGCANTVLPLDDNCTLGYTKAIYREFIVADSGIVSFVNTYATGPKYKIFKGDANALAIAQSAFNYPQTISGLTPQTLCLENSPFFCDNSNKVCVLPGTYTSVTYGNNNSIGIVNQLQTTFNITNTTHYNLATAEDMGDILSTIPPTGGSVTSSADYFSCKDNAIVIDGFEPCKPYQNSPITATKAIYRQFYLSSPASISITSQPANPAANCFAPFLTLFKGKATDGLAGLTVMPAAWRCFTQKNTIICDVLPAGWYTVVAYGWGPSYQDPMRDVNSSNGGYTQYSGWVGFGNKIVISAAFSPCAAPKYNRPYKAAIDTITSQPFLIQWAPRVGSTPAYPKTDTTYTLYTENFDCTIDTPFVNFSIPNCVPGLSKIALWVFCITQESFVRINTGFPLVGGNGSYRYGVAVYPGNARTDSASFATVQPIQPCIRSVGQIQLCKLQPGDYTIVVYTDQSAYCNSVTPTIYIDGVGYSRFDHANNAYDFGLIPPDGVYRNGKPGDVNPLNSSRAPSNDFFYCTTGSQPNEPSSACYTEYLSSIYAPGVNNPLYTVTGTNPEVIPRRSLWYTFTIDKGGIVRVKVEPKTAGKTIPVVSVYKSDVNGTIPFSTVVSSGAVDSTIAQGLTLVATNLWGPFVFGHICDVYPELTFTRQSCSPIPERYYVIVENRNVETSGSNPGVWDTWRNMPNHQVEVSVLFDSVNAIQPQFDHYYQANNIGTDLGPGTYTGATDNFSCATRDATDPLLPSCSSKTLWYKFSINFSGLIKNPAVYINGDYNGNDQGHFNLYRQIIPGDSTFTGLQYVPLQDGLAGPYTQAACISAGTYYILLPTCGYANGTEYPVFELLENVGDYCSRPVTATLNGAGSFVATAIINCHTIGTDYGEFNPTLTCPAGAITNQYKTSWFRIDVTGTNILDVTTYLSSNTNATPSQIKYRLMNGDCGAMQERSCVQDAMTHDTYQCMRPGSYWVQVFTPVNTTGTIDLHISAVQHVDTCAPINPCLSNANFQKQFDCTQSTAVRFINYSTFGASVSYQWNFGYNGQTSTAVSPQFVYPSLTMSQTYYITLTVTNNICGGVSSYMDSIVIPARPVVNLGADTSLCNGGSVVLNATSYPGATYLWNTNASTPTINVSTPGLFNYIVTVTYNNCIARDTIRVNIDPISPLTEYKYICDINSVQLNSARGLNESHNWSTGATTSSINIFNPGIYWDDISLNGCVTRDSFIVSTAAYPLGNDRQVCFGNQSIVLNATTQGATGYTWQNGTTGATFNTTAAGLYWVDISFGSCSLRDTVVLSNLQPVLGNIGATICQGQTYTLPSGNSVGVAGIYSDTTRSVRGCDSLINTVNLSVQTAAVINMNAAICPGQTYTLPWGTVVNTTGIYRDTLHYATGCDSVRRAVNLVVQTATALITNPTICAGQTYTLPWGTIVNAPGVYMDTLHYTSGCDSIRRTVNLTILTATSETFNSIVCEGINCTLPWGTIVNTTGVYNDTLHSVFGCDSVRRTVNLTVQSPSSIATNPIICAGQSYTLPWGTIVNAAGVYHDTLHYSTGCDSIRRTVNLTVQTHSSVITNPTICAGQNYTLPWGTVVNAPGIYMDTLHYTTGCDSIRRTVNLTILTATSETISPVICEGTNYTLTWGAVVNTSGVYRDTLHSVYGCDSVRRTVNLTVQSPTSIATNPIICAGQSYTLPSGMIVNAAGVYRDTLHYTTGCDSLQRTVNLTVQSSAQQTINPVICAGQTYTLPSGIIVSTAGVYRDTLHSTSGCDSVWRTVNLTVQSPLSQTFNPVICGGQTYSLPSGILVSSPGIYRDTLRFITGCDSLRRTVNLTVQSSVLQTTNPVICAGQTYTLPWGTIVNSTGVYSDTLHYSTGCDSVWRRVNLAVQSSSLQTTNSIICAGQNYTLPWGIVVNSAGVYRDTLHYTTGCDSVCRTVNLTVQSPASQTINPVICAGQTYTLPWGPVVNATGAYRDTLHYSTGCDSIRRIVNLTVQSPVSVTTNPIICSGQTYTLPWGSIVNTSGVYRDTLHYTTGCDSLQRTVNLIVQSPASVTTNPIICAGQTYTLPWGTIVNSAGIYRDTLHYITGCDSVRRTVNLIVQTTLLSTANPVICAGQTYTLPWGTVVNTSAVYRDTLHYTSGCDSLRRIINLTVQSPALITMNPVICQGAAYTLPWGVVVNNAGTYRDTLRYLTGCDSVRRTVNLAVTAAAVSITNATICSDETYTLPWGVVTNRAGVYKDTARTAVGCDSLIRTVNLRVDPAPSVSVSKSNDVDCVLGIAKLGATGGVKYTWTPASTLNNATIYNPVASPAATTWYKVLVTSDKGCTTEDSVQVKVIAGDIANGYLIPNAFTPNGDGKNDCFGVRTWGAVKNLRLQVYSRWGEIVFSTTDPSNCWDGTYKGVQQPSAVFVYQVWAETICGKVYRNGTVTLIR